MRRVMVTGSRSYRDIDKVFNALSEQYEEYGPFILVHGNCKDGADNFAQQWYEYLDDEDAYGIVLEKHDADWRPNGRSNGVDKGAGLKRNQKMVDLGADVCLAFPTICELYKCKTKPRHYSHGTDHCMKAAARANIPVSNYGPPLDDE